MGDLGRPFRGNVHGGGILSLTKRTRRKGEPLGKMKNLPMSIFKSFKASEHVGRAANLKKGGFALHPERRGGEISSKRRAVHNHAINKNSQLKEASGQYGKGVNTLYFCFRASLEGCYLYVKGGDSHQWRGGKGQNVGNRLDRNRSAGGEEGKQTEGSYSAIEPPSQNFENGK